MGPKDSNEPLQLWRGNPSLYSAYLDGRACTRGEVIPASTVLILMVVRAHVTQEVKAELKVASASCESKSGRQW